MNVETMILICYSLVLLGPLSMLLILWFFQSRERQRRAGLWGVLVATFIYICGVIGFQWGIYISAGTHLGPRADFFGNSALSTQISRFYLDPRISISYVVLIVAAAFVLNGVAKTRLRSMHELP